MNKLILFFAFLIFSIYNLSAQNDSIPHTIKQQEMAKSIAKKWATLITEGNNIDSLMSISKVPFALDRKKILNSRSDLKAFYQDVIKEKGKRIMPKMSVEFLYSKYEIIEKCIPINVLIIKLTLLEGRYKGDKIKVCVEVSGNNLKIIGFTD